MSLTPSYACYGCVNFANNSRTIAYHDWACRTGKYPPRCVPKIQNWLCRCDLDEDEVFTDPITDNVCWYDPDIPESEDFIGVIIQKVGNIRSSTLTREMQDRFDEGSVLGRPTKRGRQFAFELLIIATSPEGYSFGYEWLRSVFETTSTCPRGVGDCASCDGKELTIREFCPTSEDSDDTGLHVFLASAAIDGVKEVEDDYPMGAVCCFTMRKATMVLGTESPYSFGEIRDSCTIDATDSWNHFSFCDECDVAEEVVACCPVCFAFDGLGCEACSTDPLCDCFAPFVLEPEVLDTNETCFEATCFPNVLACCINDIPAQIDTVLRIRIFSGADFSDPDFSKYGMRNVLIKIYENNAGLPCPDDDASYSDVKAMLSPCSEFSVSWIPANSELIIDGRSERFILVCNQNCFDHSQRVAPFVPGESIFPLNTRCTDFIVTAEITTMQENSVPLTAFPSSMTVEIYRKYKA